MKTTETWDTYQDSQIVLEAWSASALHSLSCELVSHICSPKLNLFHMARCKMQLLGLIYDSLSMAESHVTTP